MNTTTTSRPINKIIEQYGFDAETTLVKPLGNGLINATYLVTNLANNKAIVLQKINQNVFKQPMAIVNNAELISQYLKLEIDKGDYPLLALAQTPTIEGTNFVDDGKNIWRALEYVDKCYTVEAIESVEQASQAAKAFAQFTCALASFDTNKLEEIIPNFHDLNARLLQLTSAQKEAESSGRNSRLKTAQSALSYCESQQLFINEVAELTKTLPVHVTHNDTKINNLLFCEQSNQVKVVIDLDTCMAGFLMHDFGDMVRTCCSNLPEDGTDLDKMSVRIDIFQALSDAYLEGFGEKISPREKESLVVGALLLPFMIGVRFLTDYLNGDIYFQTKHPEHNLERTLNQFKLFRLLKEKREVLAHIVQSKELISSE